MERKMKRLNQGSMMADLKYSWGRREAAYINTQIQPNCSPIHFFPIRNSTSSVTMPQTALGKRAANSFTPKAFMDKTCSQKKSGGFCQKGSKLIWGMKYCLV